MLTGIRLSFLATPNRDRTHTVCLMVPCTDPDHGKNIPRRGDGEVRHEVIVRKGSVALSHYHGELKEKPPRTAQEFCLWAMGQKDPLPPCYMMKFMILTGVFDGDRKGLSAKECLDILAGKAMDGVPPVRAHEIACRFFNQGGVACGAEL